MPFESETLCPGCGFEYEEIYEQFWQRYPDKQTQNVKMLLIEDCSDENGECEKYTVEVTCPVCGSKIEKTDWSK
jgi:hypothetical protein